MEPGPPKTPSFFPLRSRSELNWGVLCNEHHIHRRKDAVNDNQILPLASCRGHGGEPCESDIDLSFGDHQVEVCRAQQFELFRLKVELFQDPLSLHDEVDEALGSRDEAKPETARRGLVGSRGVGTTE